MEERRWEMPRLEDIAGGLVVLVRNEPRVS